VIPKVVEVIEDAEHPRGKLEIRLSLGMPGVPSAVVRARAKWTIAASTPTARPSCARACSTLAARVMNIEGLGEAVVQQLLDRGLVRSVADLYS
jgi:DNA ligase (NAD+)